jgi:hypothetical protein
LVLFFVSWNYGVTEVSSEFCLQFLYGLYNNFNV